MERDHLSLRVAILIVSISLLLFLLLRSRWSEPLPDDNRSTVVAVEVKGDISRPGIYILDSSPATVTDALAMAGFQCKIPDSIAFQKLTSGQSLEVVRKETDVTIKFGRMPGAALLACGLKLDLNSASLDELLLVPHMRNCCLNRGKTQRECVGKNGRLD